jgi:phenylacetate-CoA ligase
MNRFIHRHVLLPAFETLFKRRKVLSYWAELERSQWRTKKQLEAIQFAALKRLVEHAWGNCPYYGQEWKRLGLHPSHLKTPDDISRWPVTDRDVILQNRGAMRAMKPSMRLIVKTTGGSTGLPLQFDLDYNSNDRRVAATHRAYGWAGAAPGTKQLYLWGAPLGARALRARVKDHLYHCLHRRHVVSCFAMDDALADQFAIELERRRPDAIVAYTTPLYEVAQRLEAVKKRPTFQPSAILVGAEKIYPFQRRLIERVFGAPVFETYGSREFMLIGSECERHNGLHLTTEQLLVEVLDDDGQPTPDGSEGNVVITDLYNYGMPFIRYANGDRAIAGFAECGCGRGLPLLKKVVGRRLDTLHLLRGRRVPGEYFVYLLKDVPGVRRYQVIQEAPDHVRLTMIAPGLTDADRASIEQQVHTVVGEGVRVDIEVVAEIPLTAAGKLQVVVNRVPLERAA